MSESDQPKVLSTACFNGLWLIDGGDTVAMSFQAPDGSEVTVLVPRNAALAVQGQLADILAVPLTRRRYEP